MDRAAQPLTRRRWGGKTPTVERVHARWNRRNEHGGWKQAHPEPSLSGEDQTLEGMNRVILGHRGQITSFRVGRLREG